MGPPQMLSPGVTPKCVGFGGVNATGWLTMDVGFTKAKAPVKNMTPND